MNISNVNYLKTNLNERSWTKCVIQSISLSKLWGSSTFCDRSENLPSPKMWWISSARSTLIWYACMADIDDSICHLPFPKTQYKSGNILWTLLLCECVCACMCVTRLRVCTQTVFEKEKNFYSKAKRGREGQRRRDRGKRENKRITIIIFGWMMSSERIDWFDSIKFRIYIIVFGKVRRTRLLLMVGGLGWW